MHVEAAAALSDSWRFPARGPGTKFTSRRVGRKTEGRGSSTGPFAPPVVVRRCSPAANAGRLGTSRARAPSLRHACGL
eukprot:1178948-Prorocentrum_minimum.AAC.6